MADKCSPYTSEASWNWAFCACSLLSDRIEKEVFNPKI